MSLLNNKRKRNDFSYYSDATLFKDNFLQFKNLDIINNNENILEDNICNNNKNNTYDLFQKMFKSINSRTEAINQNNIIMSPLLRSNLFFGSFHKIKSFDKMVSNDKSNILHKLNSSALKKLSPNNKNKLFFSPFSSFKLEKSNNELINNFDKLPLRLDFGQINFSEKKNINELNSAIKNSEENTSDILGMNQNNFIGSSLLNKNNNNSNNKQNTKNMLNIQKGLHITKNTDIIGINPINTSLFISKRKVNTFHNKKVSVNKNKKIVKIVNNKKSNSINTSKPFKTYNEKVFQKKNKNAIIKIKSNKPKIYHIEKIYNKKEYKDAHEKKEEEDDINLINRFKISLKKIKQIYINSCLKIYSYIKDKTSFEESDLNNEVFISNIIKEVCDIINSKKINSSKMNEILQVNDDDKYRKHYFMFSSEAKQFCLDLINKKNFPFDIVMKMCKVPRKSLRRWSYVGCDRKKGCGRKTKNPEMEEKLVDWYKIITKKGISVTAKMIRDKAVERSSDKEFLASKGWFEKFKRKFNIKIVSNKNKQYRKYINCENSKKIIDLKEEEDDNIDYEINIINNNKDMKTVKGEKCEQVKHFKIKKLLFMKI